MCFKRIWTSFLLEINSFQDLRDVGNYQFLTKIKANFWKVPAKVYCIYILVNVRKLVGPVGERRGLGWGK